MMTLNERKSPRAGGQRGVRLALLLASAAVSIATKVTSNGYVRSAVLRPNQLLGEEEAVARDTDPLFARKVSRNRRLHKSSKSSKLDKSSKSDKSSKQKIYYLVVNPSPPTSHSSSLCPTRTPIYLVSASSDENPPPAFSEDQSPSVSPSMTSSPTSAQCPVSAMLDECPELLETVQPQDGCDCYNFCGGIYLGCCGIDEPCPLSCDVIGGFVAGCQFEPTQAPSSLRSPEPSPVTSQPTLSPAPTTQSPTETPQPTVTSSPTGTQAPTLSPKPTLTLEPTNSTLSPTGSLAPTVDNNTLSPTVELFPVTLSPFTLEYEVGQFRPAAQSDLVELTRTTNSYLQSYILSAFQSDEVLLVDIVTTYDSHEDIPDSSVVLVTFGSSALFDPDSPILPSADELQAERAGAFEGMALSGYLGMVQSLSANNIFMSTLQIFLVQSTDNNDESRVSGIGVAAASFAVLMLSVLTGAAVYRYRRRQKRHHASEKFLKDVDSTSGITKGGSSLGTDFGEVERIEVRLCETENDVENLPSYFLENDEEEIVFEQERGYIYQDEGIDEEILVPEKVVQPIVEGDCDDEGDEVECVSDSDSESSGQTTMIQEVNLSPSNDSYGFSSLESPPQLEDEEDDYASHVWSLTD